MRSGAVRPRPRAGPTVEGVPPARRDRSGPRRLAVAHRTSTADSAEHRLRPERSASAAPVVADHPNMHSRAIHGTGGEPNTGDRPTTSTTGEPTGRPDDQGGFRRGTRGSERPALTGPATGPTMDPCTSGTVRGSSSWSSVPCSPCGPSLRNGAGGAAAGHRPRGAPLPATAPGAARGGRRPGRRLPEIRRSPASLRAGARTPSAGTNTGTGRGANGPSTCPTAASPAPTHRRLASLDPAVDRRRTASLAVGASRCAVARSDTLGGHGPEPPRGRSGDDHRQRLQAPEAGAEPSRTCALADFSRAN